MRTALGVIAGFVVWSVLWLGTNALLRGAGMLPTTSTEPISATAPLAALLIASVICSIAAGYTAARAAHVQAAAPILGIILLVVGIIVQTKYWHLMPAWYSIAFLVLLLPMAVAGGRMYHPGPMLRATTSGA